MRYKSEQTVSSENPESPSLRYAISTMYASKLFFSTATVLLALSLGAFAAEEPLEMGEQCAWIQYTGMYTLRLTKSKGGSFLGTVSLIHYCSPLTDVENVLTSSQKDCMRSRVKSRRGMTTNVFL